MFLIKFYLFVLINIFEFTLQATVTWLPNTSFSLPKNFKDGKLPCSKQSVIFPESVSSSILIEDGTSVSEFILPIDGELVLAGSIEFGPSDDANCTEGNVYYSGIAISFWAQPDVWSSPKFNEATPDTERIPCFDDTVEFPQNSEFIIVLPDTTQRVKDIRLGQESLDTSAFNDYVKHQSDQRQQFILNEYGETGVVTNYIRHHCASLSGCPCQTEELKIGCTAKYCAKPTCIDPIQPKGHCCKICGGFIVFDIDQSFNMMSFIAQIDEAVERYDKNLVYHVGRPLNNKVQVVVVEKGEYTGKSAEFVNSLKVPLETKLLQISGVPHYKSGLNGKIFLSTLFAVVAILGAIYFYYYRLPQLNFSVLDRPRMFSRYHQRTESIVSLTRRDSGVAISSGSRAFRNPLYDSKRQRVIVEETNIEDFAVTE